MITESFLQYIWQHQCYNKQDLSISGQLLRILELGQLNTNAGPDFSNASIMLGGLRLQGSVELHVRSSDWQKHGHQILKDYSSVILHVVWEDDLPICQPDGLALPTLVLQPLVKPELIKNWQKLCLEPSNQSLPCEFAFAQVPQIYKSQQLSRMLIERLEQKTHAFIQILERSDSLWEQAGYSLLMRHLGFGVNNDTFLRLSYTLPLKILRKHSDSIFQLEALLFGQAGFLDSSDAPLVDEYSLKLQKEYEFLSHKYELKPSQLKQHEWKFLRMRPTSFPTVRLGQMAALLYNTPAISNLLTQHGNFKQQIKAWQAMPSDYWQTHYQLGKPSARPHKGFSDDSIANLLNNVSVVFRFALAKHQNLEDTGHQALELLEQLPPEQNSITQIWAALGLKLPTMADTQASLQLYKNHCLAKQCLNCAIGSHILKRKPEAN